jgi:hypothetical protein
VKVSAECNTRLVGGTQYTITIEDEHRHLTSTDLEQLFHPVPYRLQTGYESISHASASISQVEDANHMSPRDINDLILSIRLAIAYVSWSSLCLTLTYWVLLLFSEFPSIFISEIPYLAWGLHKNWSYIERHFE